MKRTHKETGALTIDAILGITIFIISVLSIMFVSLIIRIQANVQYALGQTAKEISGYYYLLDKTGLAAATAGTDASGVKDVDKTIGYVLDFSDSAADMTNQISSVNITDGLSMDELKQTWDACSNAELYQKASNIGSQISVLSANPKQQITAVLSVFAKTMVNGAMSYYVAPFVCREIMPRYMGGDKEAANKMLEAAGVEGGLDAVDFSESQLLTDKRSIKLVAIYKLDVSKLTFGIVNTKLVFKQAASTAAWINPNGTDTLAIKDLAVPSRENAEDVGSKEDSSEG